MFIALRSLVRVANVEVAVSPSTLTWVDRIGRAGLVAKAVVYAIIGGYALQFALGNGGGFLDKEDVAKKVEIQPFGKLLLLALGVGLVCYAAWRLVDAFANPRGKHGAFGLLQRAGAATSGVVHGLLAVTAFQTLMGTPDGHRSWLARALVEPGGRWLFVGAGLIMCGVGVYQIWRAFTERFTDELDQREMPPSHRAWAVRFGKLGLGARGVVFPIVGWFFIQAGLDTAPSKAQGTAAALRELARAPLGTILLPVVAAGLIAYAGLLLVNARYRRPFA